MKKIKLDSARLQLKKETISNLTNDELKKIQGGYNTQYPPCGSGGCNTSTCPAFTTNCYNTSGSGCTSPGTGACNSGDYRCSVIYCF